MPSCTHPSPRLPPPPPGTCQREADLAATPVGWGLPRTATPGPLSRRCLTLWAPSTALRVSRDSASTAGSGSQAPVTAQAALRKQGPQGLTDGARITAGWGSALDHPGRGGPLTPSGGKGAEGAGRAGSRGGPHPQPLGGRPPAPLTLRLPSVSWEVPTSAERLLSPGTYSLASKCHPSKCPTGHIGQLLLLGQFRSVF